MHYASVRFLFKLKLAIVSDLSRYLATYMRIYLDLGPAWFSLVSSEREIICVIVLLSSDRTINDCHISDVTSSLHLMNDDIHRSVLESRWSLRANRKHLGSIPFFEYRPDRGRRSRSRAFTRSVLGQVHVVYSGYSK